MWLTQKQVVRKSKGWLADREIWMKSGEDFGVGRKVKGQEMSMPRQMSVRKRGQVWLTRGQDNRKAGSQLWPKQG